MKTTFLTKWVIFIPLFAVASFSACDKEENTQTGFFNLENFDEAG